MNLLAIMQSGLYLIMNALLYPVIVLLIFFIFAVLFISGNFFSEFMLRRNRSPEMDDESEQLATRVSNELLCGRCKPASGHIRKNLESSRIKSRPLVDFKRDLAVQVQKGATDLDIRAEKLLHDHEVRVIGLLDKTRMMARVGPMLGLMGTLIPMGPALLALTSGDLKQMADCLIIAFGTTVAGLAVGALAYGISIVRQRWYTKDLKDMEYIVDLMIRRMEEAARAPGGREEEKVAVLPMARG